MLHVAVNAAGGEKSHKVQRAALCLAVLHCGDQGGICKEVAVLNGLGNLHQHLVNDTSCADVGVTYLGVAHLTVGETNVQTGRADSCVGVLGEIFVKIGLFCGDNSVSVGILIDAEAVHNN